MKPARQFGPLPHVRARPELTACPHCGAPLVYSHAVWAKVLQTLAGLEHLTNLGYRCSDPTCAFVRSVYRSAQAEARQVKGSGYGRGANVPFGCYQMLGNLRLKFVHEGADAPVKNYRRELDLGEAVGPP